MFVSADDGSMLHSFLFGTEPEKENDNAEQYGDVKNRSGDAPRPRRIGVCLATGEERFLKLEQITHFHPFL